MSFSEFELEQPTSRQAKTRVVVGQGARLRLSELLSDAFGERPYVVIADRRVAALWLAELGLELPMGVLEIPSGEACKTPDVLFDTCRQLVRIGLGRDAYVVALGGGTTGDLAGLAASLHLRGIPVVQVPTSLLAMVDAGLGGKCAIDLPEGKNLFGAFWAASLLVVDPEFLETLPALEMLAAFGEIAKYGLGFDAELFAAIESGPPSGEAMTRIVETCLRIKAGIVDADPFETLGKRRLLNLGHTSAHAIEGWALECGAPCPHGLAVGVGLRVALRLAQEEGLLDSKQATRAARMLDALQLPRGIDELVPDPADRGALLPYLHRDKKVEGQRLNCVLPDAIGSCRSHELSAERVADATLAQ